MDASKAQKLAQLQELIDSVPAKGLPVEEPDEEARVTRRRNSRRRAHNSVEDESQGMAVEKPAIPPQQAAFKRIVELCGYHEFCRSQMRDRLKRDGLPEDAIDAAIAESVRIGLIDDIRWGEMRVSALMRKGKGIEGIERELREQGISPDSIDGWPTVYADKFGNEHERALRVLEKNPPRSKNPRASAYAKLVRKGYSSSVAARVSASWFGNRSE